MSEIKPSESRLHRQIEKLLAEAYQMLHGMRLPHALKSVGEARLLLDLAKRYDLEIGPVDLESCTMVSSAGEAPLVVSPDHALAWIESELHLLRASKRLELISALPGHNESWD